MNRSFRIVLISPYGDVWNMGLRQISACLQTVGWETRLIFLPLPEEQFYIPAPHPQSYSDRVRMRVCDLCADADLVGISVMSNFAGRARVLSETVHQHLSIPVIWGGIHPTVKPEESLNWADFVCVGEGEQAIVELVSALAEQQDCTRIPNIWAKDSNQTIWANSVRGPNHALDALPFPDYNLDQQYVLHQGQVVKLTPTLLAQYSVTRFAGKPRISYMTHLSRGCPYECTYCCNNAFTKLYPDWRHIRHRNHERVVAEIDAIRQLLPLLEGVCFSDETFLAMSETDILHFGQLYQEKIGLPFLISTTPTSITEEKIHCLVEAGLQDVLVGFQTGSQRMRELYLRPESNKQVIAAAECLNRFKHQIPAPRYDVISDNPYETDTDRLQTLELCYQIPRPRRLQSFSLTFYPGTHLYLKAKSDGLLDDEEQSIYQKNYSQLEYTYYNFVLLCFYYNLPQWLLWLLIKPAVFWTMSSAMAKPFVQLLWEAINQLRIWRIEHKHQIGLQK